MKIKKNQVIYGIFIISIHIRTKLHRWTKKHSTILQELQISLRTRKKKIETFQNITKNPSYLVKPNRID